MSIRTHTPSPNLNAGAHASPERERRLVFQLENPGDLDRLVETSIDNNATQGEVLQALGRMTNEERTKLISNLNRAAAPRQPNGQPAAPSAPQYHDGAVSGVVNKIRTSLFGNRPPDPGPWSNLPTTEALLGPPFKAAVGVGGVGLGAAGVVAALNGVGTSIPSVPTLLSTSGTVGAVLTPATFNSVPVIGPWMAAQSSQLVAPLTVAFGAPAAAVLAPAAVISAAALVGLPAIGAISRGFRPMFNKWAYGEGSEQYRQAVESVNSIKGYWGLLKEGAMAPIRVPIGIARWGLTSVGKLLGMGAGAPGGLFRNLGTGIKKIWENKSSLFLGGGAGAAAGLVAGPALAAATFGLTGPAIPFVAAGAGAVAGYALFKKFISGKSAASPTSP